MVIDADVSIVVVFVSAPGQRSYWDSFAAGRKRVKLAPMKEEVDSIVEKECIAVEGILLGRTMGRCRYCCRREQEFVAERNYLGITLSRVRFRRKGGGG
jgi:hypothetical protein